MALSPKGCAIVRDLYRHDYVLWQRHCAEDMPEEVRVQNHSAQRAGESE
jgi:hypothetical protein